MSLCCIVLDHPSVTTQTKSLIVRSIFQTEAIEIELLDSSRMVVYLKKIEKVRIWQVTVDLESAGITTVYAFGQTKGEVLTEALSYLEAEIPLIHE